ncbi:MAG TPA: glycoside hydrolase family 3 protein [Chitinispirillaceae bacterium]|nr:glycoside hydrolase family 3 protein [Chitinispirillaceae bacterium]
MKCSVLLLLLTAMLFTLPIQAQTIRGKVVDKRSKGIAGVQVSLKLKGTTTTTDMSGTFTLNGTATLFPHSSLQLNHTVWINKYSICFYMDRAEKVSIELFNMNGKRAGNIYECTFQPGTFSVPVSSLTGTGNAAGVYIVRFTKGSELLTFPFNALSTTTAGFFSVKSNSSVLAKQLTTIDSLIVSKDKYITISKAVNPSTDQDVGTITLELVNDPDILIEKKVDSLLALMSIDEKIAQTGEAVVNAVTSDELKTKAYGSVFNGGGCPFTSNAKSSWATNLDAYHDAARQGPHGIPILYGIDAVHGVATIEGATIFPHNVAMGCTRDTALVAKMANITAKECRAVGINLNFAPCISVVRNEKWGRSYEGYGETPEINALMSAAYIRGLQGYGDLSRPDAVAACAKHFIGDGGTTDGVNGGVTNLSEATIRAVHLPPYEAAVKEMVASVMPSYNAWERSGGVFRCTNDKYSLDILKVDLKWDGFYLSDWDAIPLAVGTSDAYTSENISKALNAGIDMAMVAPAYTGDINKKINDYISILKTSVPGSVTLARLDDAVKRILRIKFRMNLFENAKSNSSLLAEFGSAAHRAVARECVQKSLVLLKNEGDVLPLKTSEKIVVVGPWANSMGAQCGGWTITWQGLVNNPTISGGTTILKGLLDAGGANVTFDENGTNLSAADKIVLVIGEPPYSEGQGDNGRVNPPSTSDYIECPGCIEYPGKAVSLKLSECPKSDLLEKCFNSNKPVIVVLISGRPLIIADEIAKAKGFVAAWFPGSEGAGVADVLYKVSGATFTGKLNHTWPKSLEQIPINTGTSYADEPKGSGGTPLFEFGFGLTY